MSYPVLCGAVVLTSANNAIRFTEGATTATTTIPAGTYYLRGGYATNLAPQSEDFGSWSTSTGTTTTNAGLSPTGTLTADLIDSGGKYIAPGLGFGFFVFSCYAKKQSGSPLFTLRFDLPVPYEATFNLDSGTVSAVATQYGISASITNVGNGWYRCAASANYSVVNFVVQTSLNSKIFVWGAQVEKIRNIVRSPNDFATAWSLSGVTASALATAAPDGVTGYNAVLNSTTVGINSAYDQVIFTDNGKKTFSVYVQQGTSSNSAILVFDATTAQDKCLINITWSGGVPSAVVGSGSGTVSVTSVGSGWYLITATADNVIAKNTHQFHMYPAGRIAATGTTRFWGAQAHNAIVPGLYVPTTGASATGPSDELSLAVKTALEAATASTNTYDVTVSRNISPSLPHTIATITRTNIGGDGFGVLWADALTTFDERLLGFTSNDIFDVLPKESVQACAANWVGNDVPREMEPVSERVVSVPRAASGRVQGVSRSARMQSWRMGLAFVDERRMLVDRALSVPGDTLEGFLERFGANAALEAWEAFIDTGTNLLPLSLANLWSVMHFSEDTLSGFSPTRLGPGVPLYSIDLRLHSKV